MIRCLVEECKHNDDGFCDESGYFSPTINYLDGWGVPPVCEDYELREREEEET